jgi:hypothetical protein
MDRQAAERLQAEHKKEFEVVQALQAQLRQLGPPNSKALASLNENKMVERVHSEVGTHTNSSKHKYYEYNLRT